MKTLNIPFVPTLDDMDIKEVAAAMETRACRQTIDTVNWQTFPYKPVTVFDIARGKETLYLHFFVRGLSLKALAEKDGQHVHTDSCVEFFVRRNDELFYTNFEFNCIGTCLAGRGEGRHGRTPFTESEYIRIRRYATVNGPAFEEKKGIHEWQVTVAIPFELMGLETHELPESLRANFYKCADETENPHYVTWNPIDLPEPDYHCPEHFGEIRFPKP